ncbi:hypothetical protein TELCIR_02073 [Teladorsagia circumcincta]|uniref:3'-5' exonuclease n=1 Tax=Teladorsagia circumcincta TaxID=45464 RepID=A0A2G9V067_TELCI|nr:hypothetical protein TELCIR_02073 [Teladorsagia circumcincta]
MDDTPSTDTISSTVTADEAPRKLTKAEKKALYRPAHAEPLETRRKVLKDVYLNEKNETLREELLTSILFSIFELDGNPYDSMLQLHKISPDYASNKPKSLAGIIVMTFHKWLLKRDDDVELFDRCITQELQMEAFRIATAKHTGYLKLFKEIFCLSDTELLSFIKEKIDSMIDRHMFKEAMDVVEEFGLHGKTIEKMIYKLANELALPVESVAPNLFRARKEGDLRFKAQSSEDAVRWVVYCNIPDARLPRRLQEYINNTPGVLYEAELNIRRLEARALDVGDDDTELMPGYPIIMITTWKQLGALTNKLKDETHIGIDSEWKPQCLVSCVSEGDQGSDPDNAQLVHFKLSDLSEKLLGVKLDKSEQVNSE